MQGPVGHVLEHDYVPAEGVGGESEEVDEAGAAEEGEDFDLVVDGGGGGGGFFDGGEEGGVAEGGLEDGAVAAFAEEVVGGEGVGGGFEVGVGEVGDFEGFFVGFGFVGFFAIVGIASDDGGICIAREITHSVELQSTIYTECGGEEDSVRERLKKGEV